MLYYKPEFFLLLAVVALACQVGGLRTRRVVIAAGSLLFAMRAGWVTFSLLLAVILTIWTALRLYVRWPHRRSMLVGVSVTLLLGNLFVWKYLGWVLEMLDLPVQGGFSRFLTSHGLPVGISFYSLQAIAYIVDIHRGTARRVSFFDFLLFQSFFGQLIAGPIVRHDQLMPQVASPPKSRAPAIASGIELFSIGFVKKLVLADGSAQYVDPVFADLSLYGGAVIFFALVLYTVQIWADFSGYVDMGRGAARICGINLPENFSSPYLASTISDFWRRWHITLSTWLRDYVYIPLGGSRSGRIRTLWNLFATMFLCGLWHGANWTFVCWGLYHGLLLVIHRFMRRWLPVRWPRPLAIAGVFAGVMFGWLLFRVHNLNDAVIAVKAMAHTDAAQLYELIANQPTFVTLTAAFLLAALGLQYLQAHWHDGLRPGYERMAPLLRGVVVGVVWITAVALRGDAAPFIYFAF